MNEAKKIAERKEAKARSIIQIIWTIISAVALVLMLGLGYTREVNRFTKEPLLTEILAFLGCMFIGLVWTIFWMWLFGIIDNQMNLKK